MNIRTLCLGILHFCEATGYEINKAASEGNFSHFTMASYGSIYPTLTKMEAIGLVSCREEPEPGKPTRKVYSLTDAGQEALIEALSEHPRPDIFKSEFLFQCLFARHLDPAHISSAIDLQISRVKDEIIHLGDARDECSEHLESKFAVEYGLALNKAALKYLLANRHIIEEKRDDTDIDTDKDAGLTEAAE